MRRKTIRSMKMAVFWGVAPCTLAESYIEAFLCVIYMWYFIKTFNTRILILILVPKHVAKIKELEF
jgi:hypothetical protein